MAVSPTSPVLPSSQISKVLPAVPSLSGLPPLAISPGGGKSEAVGGYADGRGTFSDGMQIINYGNQGVPWAVVVGGAVVWWWLTRR